MARTHRELVIAEEESLLHRNFHPQLSTFAKCSLIPFSKYNGLFTLEVDILTHVHSQMGEIRLMFNAKGQICQI